VGDKIFDKSKTGVECWGQSAGFVLNFRSLSERPVRPSAAEGMLLVAMGRNFKTGWDNKSEAAQKNRRH
jgi:hypothetical protein